MSVLSKQNVAALVARFADMPGHPFLTIATFVLSVFSLFFAGSALHLSMLARAMMALAQLLPLIGLFALSALSQKASELLANAGYRVGLFGAGR